jgi:hypothetical protein
MWPELLIQVTTISNSSGPAQARLGGDQKCLVAEFRAKVVRGSSDKINPGEGRGRVPWRVFVFERLRIRLAEGRGVGPKEWKMSQSYLDSVNQAQEQLEMARTALPRDVAQAVDSAGWGKHLRDKFDVFELVKRISEQLDDNEFLQELRAAADQTRQETRRVGRPKKVKDSQSEG